MKKFAAAILTAGMLAVFGASALASGNVTMEQAKQTALNRAGVAASDVRFTKAHKDRDDGRMIYEIEFWKGNPEDDVEVDAQTGKVRDFDVGYHNYEYDDDGFFDDFFDD